jgi:hypothetical protein
MGAGNQMVSPGVPNSHEGGEEFAKSSLKKNSDLLEEN